MPEFHRMITYLHLYEHGTKGRNIGYSKIEKRGGQCLVEIHMKNTGYSLSPIPVYFYVKNEQKLLGIPLGSLSLHRGNGDFRTRLDTADLAGYGYPLSDVKGIYLPLSDQVMFVSQWDNDDFVREQFEEAPQTASGATEPSLPEDTTPASKDMPDSAKQIPDTTQQPNGLTPGNIAQHGSQAPAAAQDTVSAPAPQQRGSNSRNSITQGGPSAPSSAQKGSPNPRNSRMQSRPSASTSAQHGGSDSHNSMAQGGPSASTSAQHGGSDSHNSMAQDAPTASASAQHGGSDPHSSMAQDAPSASASAQQNGSGSNPGTEQDTAAAQPDAASSKAMEQASPLPGNITAAEAAPNRIRNNRRNISPFPRMASPRTQEPVLEDWNLKWQLIMEKYPVMTPFAGDEHTLCVRLELKDLRILPKKYWYLGNNSFLLHGFFNYRHLILGVQEKSGNKKWFLGIPGIFQNPERVMASLFGFPEFRNTKSAPANTGEFGYWYRYLDESNTP